MLPIIWSRSIIKNSYKKFFECIEPQTISRKIENYSQESIIFNSKQAIKQLKSLKNKKEERVSETTLETTLEKKKSPRNFKNRLKRGMTVKFKDNETLLTMIEQNALVKKHWQDKTYTKRMYRRDSNEKNKSPKVNR